MTIQTGRDWRELVKQNGLTLILIWTGLLTASLGYTLFEDHRHAATQAATEARSFFELNLAYRHWVSRVGGVYASADKVIPNPYLDIPDRDITTEDGKRLTKINPAYLTRLAFNVLHETDQLPVQNRLTSLKYLNPVNAPNDWENKALLSFEEGKNEAIEVISAENKPFLMLMKPFKTEESCLACHGHQGYKIGDIRGGLSIAVPLDPYYAVENEQRMTAASIHFILWGVGAAGIVVFSRRRYQQDTQLKRNEWKFRTLAETAHDWDYWIKADGSVESMSSAAMRITGYTAEEFIKDPKLINETVHPEDRIRWQNHLKSLEDSAHHEMEFRILTKNGDVRWVDHVCAPMFQDRQFLGRHTSNRDITERKRAEDEQKRLEDQLRQAQKMEAIGTLAGGVAHDFNNILTAIIGYGNIVKMRMKPDDPQQASVDQILSASQRAARLTQGLLAFSRKQAINSRPVDINNIVRNVESLLRSVIGEDIDLTVRPADKSLVAMADPGQIEQVLMNLAVNARDAMPEGGTFVITTGETEPEKHSISTEGPAKSGKHVVISVSDTGNGIDTLTRDKIFEPFFTTKDPGKGTGLGLAIVYGIIKQHDGTINVYSEPGKGTTFRIYLPLLGGSPPRQTTAEIVIPPGRGTETIFLAEDEESVRKLMRDALAEFGYQVITAVDGQDALEQFAARATEIDLVILDVIMPKKSGKEVYDAVRAARPGLAVLFISGYTADIISKKGIFEENIELLSKPLSPYELLRKIREMLDRH